MKTLIGGAIAAAVGLILVVLWFSQFLMVLAGTIPAILLLGGALAIYLGFDELKDTWKKEETVEETSEAPEEVEKVKQDVSELKEEIEELKKE
jgi:hypothetical protein